MTESLLLIVVGLALLAGGGEALVRGAVAIASSLGLTPAVIGLTVVAMGTSMPELAVSVIAALQGNAGIAVSNVLGSNIFNITAVLGLTAAVAGLPVQGTTTRREWPFLFAVTCACPLVMLDGMIGRAEGFAFVITLVIFTAYAVRIARREVRAVELQEYADAIDNLLPKSVTTKHHVPTALAMLAAGVLLLVIGARILLVGAVAIAELIGMTDRVIGLTVVAAGTGAPELAASIIAVRRRQADVAIGNIIGSNVFNILGILGLSAIIRPIAVPPESAGFDSLWMIGATLLLLPILIRGRRITRGEGVVLVGAYIVYLGLLL